LSDTCKRLCVSSNGMERCDVTTYSEPLHHPSLAVGSGAVAASATCPGRDSPLVVGVLGHRELNPERVPRLRNALAGFLADLEHHLPDTELQVIVGVTRSSDLLFVHGALERGLHVEIVLPEARDAREAVLEADERAALQGLLEHPRVSCTMLSPPPFPTGSSEGDGHGAHYTNLTEALVRRSSILLTLWHGHSPAHGGIADAALRHVGVNADDAAADVSLMMLGLADDIDATDSVVYWTPAAAPASGSTAGTRGASRMPAQLARQLLDLNSYNRDYRRLHALRRDRTLESLLARIPPEVPLEDRPALTAVDAEFGKADALALFYQARSDRLFGLFASMAFTMGLAYLTYEKLAHRNALLVSYLVVLICSLSLYYALRGQHWYAKHLTYRALAETLRVTFYLRLVGIDQRLDAARVLALSGINRFHGFSLITHVLAALAVRDANAADRQAPDPERSRCMEREWIDGQYRYFVAKVSQLRRKGRRVKALKNALFVTIVVVIVAMILSDNVMEGYTVDGVTLKNVVTFAEGLFALLLGAWQLHDNHKASRELLLQYRNQGSHFARARERLAGLTDPAERCHALIELGRDSLMESYMWTIHRYHREHEPAGRR
jgi:hypothetical protein